MPGAPLAAPAGGPRAAQPAGRPSDATLRCRDKWATREVLRGATALGDVPVEQYLDGSGISVDAAWYEGRAHPAFVARKECGSPPYFGETGHLVDAGTRRPPIRPCSTR